MSFMMKMITIMPYKYYYEDNEIRSPLRSRMQDAEALNHGFTDEEILAQGLEVGAT